MMAGALIVLARSNVAMALAILIVLTLRRPVRRWAGAGAAYALWSVVPAAGLASLLPAVSSVPAAGFTGDAVVAQIARAKLTLYPSATAMIFGAWAAGAATTFGLLAWRQTRFVASLGRLEPMNENGGLRLQAARSGVGPVVIGALRPRIVTPADFEQCFAPEERVLIFAHEDMHVAKGDTLVNAAAAAAQCACWFNPFIHAAIRPLRIDQELACDAAVLSRFPGERRRYGEVLLKTQLSTRPLPFGCQWRGGAGHPLKERIAMLKSPFPNARRRALGMSLVAAVALTTSYAAWAAEQSTDFSGAWAVKGDIKSGRNLARAAPVCTFKQAGEALTGTCEGPNSRGPATGTISGQHVAWRWTFTAYTHRGLGGTSTFDGTVGKDGVVHGAWTYSGLPGASGVFTGQRKG